MLADMTGVAPIVHVLVPSFNQRAALIQCLESVFSSRDVDLQVLVVDDGSTDDSVAEVRRRFPACEVLMNVRNLGFAANCNAGFQLLLQKGARLIFLLNQDARVAPDALARLAVFFDQHPRAGIVGPKTYSFDKTCDGHERLLYAGSWHGLLPLRQHIPGIEAAEREPRREPVETDYVWGHGMMIRGSVLQQTGGFDPAFPMYCEDLDLCRRLRTAGYQIWCEPRAVMWHDQPDGARAIHSEYWRWACKVRSTTVFHRKHFGRLAAAFLTPATHAAEIGQLLRQRKTRAAWHLARATMRWSLGLSDSLRQTERMS